MANYPSVLTTFTDPVPTDKLSTTPHSSIETAQNNGLRQLQAFIGTESSVVGTLMYDIRGAGSNGGGHVQTANKGGTGQTTYTKGDVLIAQSSSVLTKLAVGADGTVLGADSTAAVGLSYIGVATATTLQNQTNTYANASVLSASVWGITFPTAVSSLVQGQSFTVKFPTSNTSSVIALQVSSLTSLRIKNQDLTNPEVGTIQASMIGILENDGTQFQLVTPSKPGSFISALTATGGQTTTTNIDTVFTPGFAPKVITIYYTLMGANNSVGNLDSCGVAIYNNIGTLIGNLQPFSSDVANPNGFGSGAPTTGGSTPNGMTVVLSVTSVTATTFTVRVAFTVATAGSGSGSFVAVATP